MIRKSTLKLLRIPFSINLLPIFLFAVYSAMGKIDGIRLLLVFILIHFVFYPASNAYNSYMDADDGPIAGIANPPAPTKELFYVSVILDALGLLLSLFVSIPFTVINFVLVCLSRAYSWHGIRIKKYPLPSFFMVALAQGGLSYFNMWMGIQGISTLPAISTEIVSKVAIATCFVGAIYPITQIYQHEQDKKSGDMTLSLILGVKGTFVFSGILFIAALTGLFVVLPYGHFWIFFGFMVPAVGYFTYWALISWNNSENANFKRTMTMALGASGAMILAFICLIAMEI